MNYKYDIIRGHRKSISISVSNENKITVRCPWGMSALKIDEFVSSKSDWLDKVVMRNAVRLANNDDVIEYRSIYVDGIKLPLIFGDRTEITDKAVYVKNIGETEQLYKNTFSEQFLKRVEELSAITLLKPESVKIKSYRGRWGCCDSKNNLIFNYMLFMLPQKVRDYVIIHELCHILCHNHSAAFWKLVSDYEPDYKSLKAELSGFDFLTNLY